MWDWLGFTKTNTSSRTERYPSLQPQVVTVGELASVTYESFREHANICKHAEQSLDRRHS